MYNEQIEALINAALADGVLNEKATVAYTYLTLPTTELGKIQDNT